MATSDWRVDRVETFPARDNPLGNNFYGYRRTALTLPGGARATYNGVVVGPCVHVVAVDKDLTTYLVRQSRPNAMQPGDSKVPITLELPGGFADQRDGEGQLNLQASAASELKSETGLVAATLTRVGQLRNAPGVSDELDTIFLGEEVELADTSPVAEEPTEADMRIISGNFGTLYDQMRRGDAPVVAQTLAAMALAAAHL